MINQSLLIAAFSIFFSQSLGWAATELAKINGTTITLEDFNKKYKENLKFYQNKIPTKKNVLDDLIKRELGIQEARKLGLDKDPETIERMNTVLYHSLLEKKLNKSFETIFIEDAEAKAYYERNPEIRTSHIYIAVSQNAKKEEETAALEKIKNINENFLKKGKMSFAEIAQQHSEGTAAPMGGDIDYQMKDTLDPTFYDAAVQLQTPGKISGIVRSAYGYHIIKLTAMRSWSDVDRPKVKRILIEQKRRDLFEAYLKDLRQGSKVVIHSELVAD